MLGLTFKNIMKYFQFPSLDDPEARGCRTPCTTCRLCTSGPVLL